MTFREASPYDVSRFVAKTFILHEQTIRTRRSEKHYVNF